MGMLGWHPKEKRRVEKVWSIVGDHWNAFGGERGMLGSKGKKNRKIRMTTTMIMERAPSDEVKRRAERLRNQESGVKSKAEMSALQNTPDDKKEAF
jgi:hypothetical protein